MSKTTASRSSLGIEGGQTGGELLGQHGKDLGRGVDGGGVVGGMLVDGRPLLDERIHVGDGHLDPDPSRSEPVSATVSWSRSRELSLSMEAHRRCRRSRTESAPPPPSSPEKLTRATGACRVRPGRRAKDRGGGHGPASPGGRHVRRTARSCWSAAFMRPHRSWRWQWHRNPPQEDLQHILCTGAPSAPTGPIKKL